MDHFFVTKYSSTKTRYSIFTDSFNATDLVLLGNLHRNMRRGGTKQFMPLLAWLPCNYRSFYIWVKVFEIFKFKLLVMLANLASFTPIKFD